MTKRLSNTTTQKKSTKIKDELTKIELKRQKSYNHERERSELDAALKIKSNPKSIFSTPKLNYSFQDMLKKQTNSKKHTNQQMTLTLLKNTSSRNLALFPISHLLERMAFQQPFWEMQVNTIKTLAYSLEEISWPWSYPRGT